MNAYPELAIGSAIAAGHPGHHPFHVSDTPAEFIAQHKQADLILVIGIAADRFFNPFHRRTVTKGPPGA